MQSLSPHDIKLLEKAFPSCTNCINALCGMNPHLKELCADYVLLLSDYAQEKKKSDGLDEIYLRDLTESLAGLKSEIEEQLGQMGVTVGPIKKQFHRKDET